MCGRYGGPKELEVYSGLMKVEPPFPRQGHLPLIRPTDIAPVFVRNREGQIVVQHMRWWFVPAHHRGTTRDWTATTFNARVEGIDQKPTYARAWGMKRRVLVPASHYFETSKTSPLKQVWQIERQDTTPLAFAGVWDYAQTSEGPLLSFAILTREPGEEMRHLHPREPVVLDSEQWLPWLNGDALPDITTP